MRNVSVVTMYCAYVYRLNILSRAEGTEIAVEIVTEVCEVAFNIVYSHYLERQAFPHTITETKQSLLQIIEVYYNITCEVNMILVIQN